MSQASTHRSESGRAGTFTPKVDIFIIIPLLVCAYVEIISPLMAYIEIGPPVGGAWTKAQREMIMAPSEGHKIILPATAAISIFLAMRSWSRLTLPPNIVCLFGHLALAGISILWAFKAEFSSVRFAQQAMIIISIVLPILLASRTADVMHGMFLCFAFALIVNVYAVLNQEPMDIGIGTPRLCYSGIYTFKGILGECAAIALLFSLHEILYSGWRRIFGVIVIGIALYLVVMSDSQGSLGFAVLAPLVAGVTLFTSKRMRASPAIVLGSIPVIWVVLSSLTGGLVGRISWYLYGNYTLSGRTFIWDFANLEIARRPLLGWGYQSFWLVGPDAPSIVDAPGWIKEMPSSHSGYLDTMVDMGYLGLVSLLIFLFATLHAIGRVVEREPGRGWVLLTIALYIIVTNFIETGWMHGVDMLWLIFLIVAAETGRYWKPFPVGASEPLRKDPIIAGRRPGIARAPGSDKLGQFRKRRT
jgi:exopolysaccharide production protein ExoQ